MLTFLHIESAPSLTLFGSTLLVRNDSSTSFKASPHKMSSFANFLLALLAEMGSSKDVPTLPDVTVNFDNFGVSILLTLNLTFSHCRSEILLGANSESLLSCGFSANPGTWYAISIDFNNCGVATLLTSDLTFSHCRSGILLGAISESLLNCGFSANPGTWYAISIDFDNCGVTTLLTSGLKL